MEVKEINGYSLLAPFQGKDAGFSRWTFGMRDDQWYFLKEFQDPKYPDETTLADGLRSNRIQECVDFEDSKVRMYHRLNQISDGNVVRIAEVFRWNSHYYMVTRRIDGEKIPASELTRLPLLDRLLLCRTFAHALMKVHEAGIVHSDIKQSNVLLQKTATGRLTVKLIDFDAGFFEDSAPEEPEELNFDQSYLAPEGCLMLLGEPANLTCKMDVFSAGLLMHEYLAGEFPHFDPMYSFAHEAVLDGQRLQLDPSLPYEIRQLLERMLLGEPEERCSMADVYRELGVYFGNASEEIPEVLVGEKEPVVIEDDPGTGGTTIKGPKKGPSGGRSRGPSKGPSTGPTKDPNDFFSKAGNL